MAMAIVMFDGVAVIVGVGVFCVRKQQIMNALVFCASSLSLLMMEGG
jgi:hypothetical protein